MLVGRLPTVAWYKDSVEPYQPFRASCVSFSDSVIKADLCALYVDDTGIAANTTKQLIKNIRAVFKCIREAGLKLTIEKCHFGVTQIEFLERAITPDGVAPQDQKVKNFFSNVKFKFQIMHVAGSQNTAADFLSRLELTPKEKVHLKLRNDILTSPIEVNLQSSHVADEEQLFVLPDEEEESEQGIIARKALSKQRTIEDHEKDLSTKRTEIVKQPLNSAVYSFGALKENARIRNEQDADPLFKALKLRTLHEEYEKLNQEDKNYYVTKKESY